MTSKQLVISHSQMTMFETCPRKWHYQYIQGMKPSFVGPWLHFGKRVHSMIETELNVTDQSTYGIKDFNYDKKGNPELLYDSANTLTKEAITGLNNWDVLEFPGVEKLQPDNIEKKFEISTNNGSKFRGYIDLLYLNNSGEYVIIDWKTTSVKYKDHDIVTSPQLTAYSWVCHKLTGKLPSLVAFITLDKKTHKAALYAGTRTLDDIKQYENRVDTNYRKMLDKLSYRNENGCKGKYGKCDFYSQCWGDKKPIILQNEIKVPVLKKSNDLITNIVDKTQGIREDWWY